MLVPDSYQFMSICHFCHDYCVPPMNLSPTCVLSICHFCHDYCVPPMNLSPTCVLKYVMSSLQGCMPCIFVISMVTSTSMQSSSRDVADFRDLEFL